MMGLKHPNFKKAILVTAVMLLAGLVAAPYVLAASQTWYLRSDTSGSARIMYKSGGSTSNVTIISGNSQVWMADEVAVTDVGFSNASWSVDLNGRSWGSGTDVYVRVGSWNGTAFTQAGEDGPIHYPSGTSTNTFTITPTPFTVPTGQYLAIEVYDAGSGSFRTYTSGLSKVDSPNADPGYPVPDASAILMFAAGLGITGIIIWRFRKTRRFHELPSSQ